MFEQVKQGSYNGLGKTRKKEVLIGKPLGK
jgi:hypothetical protein